MTCSDFEDQLAAYDSLPVTDRACVDAHVLRCEGCRAFREALDEVDLALTAALSPLALAIPRRPRFPQRPPLMPALLDLAGGAGVIATALYAVSLAGTLPTVDASLLYGIAAITVPAGVLLAYRTLVT